MKNTYKNIIAIFAIVIFFIAFFSSAIYKRTKYLEIYHNGVSLLEEGNYKDAVDCFSELPDYMNYKDIRDLLKEYEVYDVCPYCGHILN